MIDDICRGPQGPQGPAGVAVVVSRIDTGNIGGSQLVAVDTAAVTDGTIATVFSVGALFRLVKSPTAALIASVDGITVVASTASPGSIWVRIIDTTDERFVANPPLFIDPTSGIDDNDGLTALTALKTANEWCRRMNGQVSNKAVGTLTVTCGAGNVGQFGKCRILATQTFADGPTSVRFVGNVTQSAEVGTVSSFVAQNPLTNTEYEFTDSSGVGPVIAADSRLRIVASATPAHVGGVGYVRGFSAGGAKNPFTTAFMETDGSTEFFPAAGDQYVVETLNTTALAVSMAVEMDAGQRYRFFWVDMLVGDVTSSLPGIAPTTTDTVSPFGDPEFDTCTFVSNTLVRLDSGNIRFSGCEFRTQVCSSSAPAGTHTFTTCVFRAGFTFRAGAAFVGSCVTEAFSDCKFCTNANTLLLSRIMSGTGLQVANDGYFTESVGILWSPLVGARNGMTIGLNVLPQGRAQVTSFAANLHVAAATPYAVNGRGTSGFYLDTASGAYLLPSASVDGALLYDHTLSTIPTANPPSGAYRFAAAGASVARGSGGAVVTMGPAGAGAAGHAALVEAKWSGGPVQTVGAATNVVLATPSLGAPGICGAIDNAGFGAVGTLVGIDGANNVIFLKVARSFKRIAGVLTELGGATTPFLGPIGDAALGAVAGILTVSGNSIILEATGVGGATINWNGVVEIESTDFVG